MNFKSIMMFLIAALTLLGVGAPALAAETAQIQAKDKEVSFNQCSVNGRLKFKDGKDGCLDNHPTFLKQGATQSFFPKQNFNLALSLNPAQCPAVYGASWGNNSSYLSNCKDKLSRIIGTVSLQCECQAFEVIAQNLSKDEFYEFERQYASRLNTGWSKSDLPNPTSVAQSPAIPATGENLDSQKDTLAKVEEDRRQKDVLAKVGEDRPQKEALVKAEEDRRQKDTFAKADEDRRQKDALAKADEDRRKKEALAKVEEDRRQKDALAKAEEDLRQKKARAKAEDERRQKEALAKAEDERRQRELVAKADEDRRQKETLAKTEEDRRQKDKLAKVEEESNKKVALAQAENLRLAAELSKLREQLSNQGGVNPVANIRKALIIGNDSYRSVTPLVNARADARLM